MLNLCGTCNWFNSEKKTCQRFPPTLFQFQNSSTQLQTYYPNTDEDDFCGEHSLLNNTHVVLS